MSVATGPGRIAVLCGGVGAARFLSGLVRAVEPEAVTAVVNTGDDSVLHGLMICPDLDTVTYTLAGLANPETGWGLAGESWQAMDALERIGGADRTWFRLGDRDLGTHLYRTGRLGEGASLSTVTAEIATAFGLRTRILPMSDDPVRTVLRRRGGEELSFQEYFVKLRHAVVVDQVRFDGAERARPAPGVLEALDEAFVVVVAPSNPIVSIGPILALPGVADVLASRRRRVVAISPIVGGVALKGPADRLLVELGGESSAAGVARHLSKVAGTLVVDEVDAGLAPAVEEAGLRAVVAPTVMSSPEAARRLAGIVLEAVPPPAAAR
ncbi:MAG TPA: 2-phospho-L-lactate transferase [Acidimicrobiales bacterium]|nr:2-phospho-L-lactate transferase [Acidimicrobiales bacterium]